MVEPSRPEPACCRLPATAVVERAGAEHRRKRGRVHPGREGRDHAVCERDEHDAGGDRRPERPEVEDPAQPRDDLDVHAPLSHAGRDPDDQAPGWARLGSRGVRLRRAPPAPLRAHAGRGRRAPLPRALRRPRVPLRGRARDPVLRTELLRARLGRRGLLPAGRRPGLCPATHGRDVRSARSPGGRARGRLRDRRRLRRLRAGREGPREARHGRDRRPRLG